MLKFLFGIMVGGLLTGCVSDEAMEQYFREQCRYDRVTFEEIKPGTPEFEFCLEMYRSGMGGYENDMHGGEGLGQFAD